jgi:hypothetical protein
VNCVLLRRTEARLATVDGLYAGRAEHRLERVRPVQRVQQFYGQPRHIGSASSELLGESWAAFRRGNAASFSTERTLVCVQPGLLVEAGGARPGWYAPRWA